MLDNYEMYNESDIHYDKDRKKYYIFHSVTRFAIWFDSYEDAIRYIRSK